MKDIARLLDVSHTTVSRALNDSPLISPATKKKIVETAKMLNYVPNYSARSLVQNKSYNVGLIFSTIGGSTSPDFFYETISGVTLAMEPGYNLVVNGVDSHTELDWVDSKRFDGIVLVSQTDKDDAFIFYAMDRGIPLVVLNRNVAVDNLVNILSADRIGAYNAVEHLIERGHREIALIGGVPGFQATTERREGYFSALSDSGIPIRGDLMADGDFTMESGFSAMTKLLSVGVSPSAVFCLNDEMAIGAMKAIVNAGYRVPEDFSVVGFDDSKFSSYVTPSLTTVRRSIAEVGRVGTSSLMSILNGNQVDAEKIFIATRFIARESVRAVG
ncbi:LacI family DNA-binding transcriptional regulator [Acidithrix ferrooxidans]|uniref:LacI family DNA-binding transcriptional regulator n=1 Tax=Acidithrix ferrooxidans TaxID=1280514 RepID=UPI00387E8449